MNYFAVLAHVLFSVHSIFKNVTSREFCV